MAFLNPIQYKTLPIVVGYWRRHADSSRKM